MAWRRSGEKPLSEAMLTQFTDAFMLHYEGMSLNLLDVGPVWNWDVLHYILNVSVHVLWSIKRDRVADRYVNYVYVFYQMN